MKLFYDYDFFARAKQSLKFTHFYWVSIESELRNNIGVYTIPGLLKYDELPLLGDIEIFYQLMLKRAIFYWKFIPCMLNDLFKAYPLFDVPFAELEISIFDSWLELPACIDELYNIILENQWSHVLEEPQEDPMFITPLCVNFDVKSHFFYDNAVFGFSERFKAAGLLESTSLDLADFNDPNNQEHVLFYLLYIKFFAGIPGVNHFVNYWVTVTTSNIAKPDLINFVIRFEEIMRKNLLITNQMLAVNSFFDLASDREKYHESFLQLSPERQKELTTFSYVPCKKKRRFNSYDEWFAWMTNVPKATEYEGYDK